MNETIVTAENIEDVRERIPGDQAMELRIGCRCWRVGSEYGTVNITVWPDTGRAAYSQGSESCWGEWNNEEAHILLDDPHHDGGCIIVTELGEVIVEQLTDEAV